MSVVCPNKGEHTNESSDTSTVYWPPATGGYTNGSFDCKHEHCKHIGLAEFKEAVGYKDADPLAEFEDLAAAAELERSIGNPLTVAEVAQLIPLPEVKRSKFAVMDDVEFIDLRPGQIAAIVAAADMSSAAPHGGNWRRATSACTTPSPTQRTDAMQDTEPNEVTAKDLSELRECLPLVFKNDAKKCSRLAAFLQSQENAFFKRLGKPHIFYVSPGYVILGRHGCEDPERLHPGLAGLDIAAQIFRLGVTAGSCLDTHMLVKGGKGNALKNALTAAAEWIEREGHPRIAGEIRRIKVSRNGGFTYDPSGLKLDLDLQPPLLKSVREVNAGKS